MLKVIHAAEDVQEAKEKALRVGAKLREQRMSKAAELVEGGVQETLAYYAFPEEHWRRIRINPLECIQREIRRRTRVAGPFPDGQSAFEPGRGQAEARSRHGMVDKELSVDGLPEGLSNHEDNRLSPVGAAHPNIKVRKTLDATAGSR